MKFITLMLHGILWLGLLPALAWAGDGGHTEQVRNTGVSALWILANFSYAGMKAQGHPDFGWRVVAFIFGFPGTLLSWMCVKEGSERAYGVELPRRNP